MDQCTFCPLGGSFGGGMGHIGSGLGTVRTQTNYFECFTTLSKCILI